MTDQLDIATSGQNTQNGLICLHLQVEEGRERTYSGEYVRNSYSESLSVNVI
jgi:hypothetical protein